MPTPMATKSAVQRALILQGGGALGAYEAGVIKALARRLTEEDERNGYGGQRPLFDIVAGASIGAMNGAMLVCHVLNNIREQPRASNSECWLDAVDRLETFWKHELANYTGGGQTWVATFGAGDLAARHLTDTVHNYPMSIKLANVLNRPDLVNGKLVVPGAPDKSVLLGRIEANDPDVRMPPIARNIVDEAGAALIREWIAAGAPNP